MIQVSQEKVPISTNPISYVPVAVSVTELEAMLSIAEQLIRIEMICPMK